MTNVHETECSDHDHWGNLINNIVNRKSFLNDKKNNGEKDSSLNQV